jgi:hypothetical protein
MLPPLKNGVKSTTPISQLSTEELTAQLIQRGIQVPNQPTPNRIDVPETQDQQAAEENAERDKEDEPDVNIEDPSVLAMQGSYKFSLSRTANKIFKRLNDSGKYFQRGSEVVRVTDKGLEPETAQSLRTTVEFFFSKIYLTNSSDADGTLTLKVGTMSTDLALSVLAMHNKQPLRVIDTVSSCPILVLNDQGELEVCNKGYVKTASGGGVYVLGGDSIIPDSLEEAVKLVLEPFEQFDFVDEHDRTRAIAMAITPAMVQSGLVGGHIPIDFAEADQSQAGEGYRHDIIASIYNESVTLVTNRRNGVGSLDESVSNAILKGKPFIRLDNLRENLDSEVLESYITTPPTATTAVRGFKRMEDVRGGQHIFQASSNGIQLTKDAANRCIITRIRKRPDGYKFHKYAEGYILEHVRDNYAKFLGAIHRVVIEWHNQGRQESQGVSHDFRAWASKLDWIMANMFNRPDMLKGHRALQDRVSDDALTTLRHIAVQLDQQGKLDGPDEYLQAHDLVAILEESGVEVKGGTDDGKAKAIGVKLGKVFKGVRDGEDVWIDGYCVQRHMRPVKYAGEGSKLKKFYVFYKTAPKTEEEEG